MTAEIVIMNKSAIALAADSAITVKTSVGPKIYNTADKLFRLSDSQPVGLMIYDMATFLLVPWEIIIKDYRNHLGDKSFAHLEDYSKDFISFVSNHDALFPIEEQEHYFRYTISEYYMEINNTIKEIVEKELQSKNKKITKDNISRITGNTISVFHDDLKKRDFLPNSSPNQIKEISTNYSQIIESAIEESFEKLPIYKKDKIKLVEIAGLLFCKDIFPNNMSGIVISGFGEKDYFPKLQSYKFETIINGRLKYKEDISASITHGQGAVLVPFAQEEMVQAFMGGVDPDLENFIGEYFLKIVDSYPDIIVGLLDNLSATKKKDLKEKIKASGEALYENFINDLNDIIQQKLIGPIIEVVNILPKDELAAMAESLVNLTMFKQRVSPTAETVGGPIDVAVISKGDGFVWIKRKNYFDLGLNPRRI